MKRLNLSSAMCKDIAKERRRIGGDWAVAQAVPTREMREFIKKELGPDLIFVVLNMTKKEQLERIKARHGNDKQIVDALTKMHSLYEPATKDEENSIDLTIANEMSRQDVVERILKAIQDR